MHLLICVLTPSPHLLHEMFANLSQACSLKLCLIPLGADAYLLLRGRRLNALLSSHMVYRNHLS